MTIHVVTSGESIWSIARDYGVSPDRIIADNGLEGLPNLVIGQALVIPSTEFPYRVKPGESLWSIARKFGVSVDSIVSLNQITNPQAVYPGLVLRIPENAKNYGVVESNAFIQPSTPEHETEVIEPAAPYLTYLSPFSYHVNQDGSLKPLPDSNIISQGRRFRAAPMMTVSNIGTANFDTELGHTILNNNAVQANLISQITGTLRTKGYYGVIVDFERIPPADRQRYNNFLRKLAQAVHADNKVLATALAPKTYDITEGAWHGAHDYRAHGEIADFSIIMTYEWGWSGGPPMAVAPLDQVEEVINYALTVMPKEKIMMGMPFYGYDWGLPYVPGGQFAESIGNEEAIKIAAANGAKIQYDYKAQSPFFNYIDKNGKRHVVWFEDARSVQAKFKLVSRKGLRGVSYWALGKPFRQNWVVLNNMFFITKVIK